MIPDSAINSNRLSLKPSTDNSFVYDLYTTGIIPEPSFSMSCEYREAPYGYVKKVSPEGYISVGGHTDTAYNGTINFSNITSIDGVGDAWVTEVNAIYYADI